MGNRTIFAISNNVAMIAMCIVTFCQNKEASQTPNIPILLPC